MYSYFCLKFKSEEQWLEVDKFFRLTQSGAFQIDSIGILPYEPEFKGEKSTSFHVNIATEKDSLPEKLMSFIVRPVLLKRTFNGQGLHEQIDKQDYEKIPADKITGFEVTTEQIKAFPVTELKLKTVSVKLVEVTEKELKR